MAEIISNDIRIINDSPGDGDEILVISEDSPEDGNFERVEVDNNGPNIDDSVQRERAQIPSNEDNESTTSGVKRQIDLTGGECTVKRAKPQEGKGDNIEDISAAGPSSRATRAEELQELKEAREALEKMREAASTIEAKYENLVTKLQAKVECPVCFDVPKKSPVYVCPSGHVVCKACKRDTCPSCRQSMLQGGRSLLAVTVIENIPHSCEFQVHGCTVRCELTALKSHQAQCPFRAIKCPNFSCPDKVPLALLAEHSLRKCIHNGTFFDSPLTTRYNYIIPADQENQFDERRNSNWTPDGITFDGHNFFLKITRKGRKSMWYFFVQMAGSEEECSRYKTIIHVYKSEFGINGKQSHRFIGDICPVDIASTDRAAEQGFCQCLTDSQMKRVFTEGAEVRDNERKFGFNVEVKIEREDSGKDGESGGEEVHGLGVESSIHGQDNNDGSSSENSGSVVCLKDMKQEGFSIPRNRMIRVVERLATGEGSSQEAPGIAEQTGNATARVMLRKLNRRTVRDYVEVDGGSEEERIRQPSASGEERRAQQPASGEEGRGQDMASGSLTGQGVRVRQPPAILRIEMETEDSSDEESGSFLRPHSVAVGAVSRARRWVKCNRCKLHTDNLEHHERECNASNALQFL